MQDQVTRTRLVIPFLLAISLSTNAASAAESRDSWSTASKSKQDLPSVEEFGLSSPAFQPVSSRHSIEGRLKVDYPIPVGLPHLDAEIHRFGEVGDETAGMWDRDATAEQVDRTSLASDTGGVRFNLTEWLSCVVEVAVPLMGDVSVKELNGDPSLNDLRVFGALTTTF